MEIEKIAIGELRICHIIGPTSKMQNYKMILDDDTEYIIYNISADSIESLKNTNCIKDIFKIKWEKIALVVASYLLIILILNAIPVKLSWIKMNEEIIEVMLLEHVRVKTANGKIKVIHANSLVKVSVDYLIWKDIALKITNDLKNA